MTWYKFWVKNIKKEETSKQNFDKEALEADFFCQLSYMAAIATSGISRSGLFVHAAKLPYVSARYFKKVEFVAKAFNYDYSEACRIVGEATKETEVKALLLRLSGTLSSGEDIATSLEGESQVFSESYGNSYERRLELLRKWADAYIALIMTAAIVTVMAVVSMMIGNITPPVILSMAVLTLIVTIAGVWLLYRTAPRETKVHSLPVRSREQVVGKKLAWITLPLAGISAVVLLLIKADLGWVLVAAAAFLCPLGVLGRIDDKHIDRRDTDVANFLRSLGGVTQAIGATVNEAIGRLDLRSTGSLKEATQLLYTRIQTGIDPHLCWDRFVGESGSEQINRSVRIFWDGVVLGGEPHRVGNNASTFAMKISLLRAKRALIDSGLLWLTMIMHLVLTSLVIFVYEILANFSKLVLSIMPEPDKMQGVSGVPSLGIYSSTSSQLGLLHFMVITIVFVLTFANAVAVYVTGGGHIYKLFFYLTLTLAISGAAMIIVPPIVKMLFAGMAP